MTPEEFWHIYALKTPPKMYGSMTEQDAQELYDLIEGFDNGSA